MSPRLRRSSSRREAATGPLSVAQVLWEEYVCLHESGQSAERQAGATGDERAAEARALGEVYEAVHRLPEKRSALCLSGGGIRSATFSLGVLQGLARAGLLPRFHYLSTVSGGGYIGGWLTAWIHRSGHDVEAVARSLASLDATRKLEPEPAPVRHLREYSNYLAPRAGLLSADTWTLLGTVLRNLILVWSVLLPLLAAGLALPRLYVALVGHAPEAVGPTWPGRALLIIGALLLAWAVAYIGASIPSSTSALRGQGQFLQLCLLPLLVSLVCLTIYWSWWPERHPRRDFVLFGALVHVAAWAGYTVWLRTPWGLRRPRGGSRAMALVAGLLELLFVVLVGAAGGGLAWLVATSLFPDPGGRVLLYASLAPAVFLSAFLLAATLLVGLLSRWTEDDDREWWARCGAWLLVMGIAWLALSGLVIYGPLLLTRPVATAALSFVGGMSGLVTLVGGWSARSSAGRDGAAAPASRFRRLVLPSAALLFAAAIAIALSMLTSALAGWAMDRAAGALGAAAIADVRLQAEAQWPRVSTGPFDHASVLLGSSPQLVAAVAIALAVAGSIAASLINTNRFSLHAMYRSRLIRAYLGASNTERRGNPFTGFDDTDNIPLHELWPAAPPPATVSAGEGRPPRRALFHVVNTALNLVHGDRLAWQERKAHSFTFSPLHAGSMAAGDDGAGYRRTRSEARPPRRHYGGPHGVSLGTALTISGAAASPNMGYHSSPLVTFLMTLFNARLGWWLGNPGPVGRDTFYLAGPRFAVRPILAEAFGLTGRTAPYVYLSDGGHFDNLGLYEMVLRRCHFIVVSDGSCDEHCQMNDLGSAVRKVRADLGIPIEFTRGISIYPRSAETAMRAEGLYWAVGRIRYSAVDPPPPNPDSERARRAADERDGWLLYVKAAFYGTEPPDVYEYAMANAEFPHESTVDQFFSESQFESYRMLGAHAIARLCEGWAGESLAELFRHADRPRPGSTEGPAESGSIGGRSAGGTPLRT